MNLAEGSGRGGREFVRFVSIAYGSLLELETQVELAHRLQLVSAADAEGLLSRTAELGKILNGLRRALSASVKHNSNPRVRDREGEYVRRLH